MVFEPVGEILGIGSDEDRLFCSSKGGIAEPAQRGKLRRRFDSPMDVEALEQRTRR